MRYFMWIIFLLGYQSSIFASGKGIYDDGMQQEMGSSKTISPSLNFYKSALQAKEEAFDILFDEKERPINPDELLGKAAELIICSAEVEQKQLNDIGTANFLYRLDPEILNAVKKSDHKQAMQLFMDAWLKHVNS